MFEVSDLSLIRLRFLSSKLSGESRTGFVLVACHTEKKTWGIISVQINAQARCSIAGTDNQSGYAQIIRPTP